MKQTIFLALTTGVLALTGCKEGTKTGYYDLNRGESIDLVKDENTELMVDAETKKPAYIYVNEETNDTIFGATGKVINGNVIKLEDGKYKYEDLKVKLEEDGDFKLKDGDYKRKVDADGDIKIKDGDKKTKIDGETGEVKHKD